MIEPLYSQLITSEGQMESFWVQILALKDELGQKKFFNLEIFVKFVASQVLVIF